MPQSRPLRGFPMLCIARKLYENNEESGGLTARISLARRAASTCSRRRAISGTWRRKAVGSGTRRSPTERKRRPHSVGCPQDMLQAFHLGETPPWKTVSLSVPWRRGTGPDDLTDNKRLYGWFRLAHVVLSPTGAGHFERFLSVHVQRGMYMS
jgi:hypothetical protein